MYAEWTGRKLKMADRLQQAFGLAQRWQWPAETYELHNKPCGNCIDRKHDGKFRLVWAGEYIGLNWKIQRRISYRCNHCGAICTYRQDVADDETTSAIEREVIIP